MKNPILITTNPHAAQELRHTEPANMREGQPIEHQLFTLSSVADDLNRVTMTGEELDSLFTQWKAFKMRAGK